MTLRGGERDREGDRETERERGREIPRVCDVSRTRNTHKADGTSSAHSNQSTHAQESREVEHTTRETERNRRRKKNKKSLQGGGDAARIGAEPYVRTQMSDSFSPLRPPDNGFPSHVRARADALIAQAEAARQTPAQSLVGKTDGPAAPVAAQSVRNPECSGPTTLSNFQSPAEYLQSLQRRHGDVGVGLGMPTGVPDGEINPSSGASGLVKLLLAFNEAADSRSGESDSASKVCGQGETATAAAAAAAAAAATTTTTTTSAAPPCFTARLEPGPPGSPSQSKSLLSAPLLPFANSNRSKSERTIADYDPRFDPVRPNSSAEHCRLSFNIVHAAANNTALLACVSLFAFDLVKSQLNVLLIDLH